MTPSIKMNFQSDKAFSSSLWACEGCRDIQGHGYVDTQSHVKVCIAYENLREGKDLDKDKDLVDYFAAVLRQRLDNV